MLTWLLLIPTVALFVAINIIIGCYVTTRFGYGPPDWKTALNLVVSVPALQDRLNAGRDWLETKAPWADKFLDRLNVPKPIVIVDFPEEEEEEEEEEETEEEEKVEEAVVEAESTDEQADDISNVPPEKSEQTPLEESEDAIPPSVVTP